MNDVHFERVLRWPLHEVTRALRDLPWTFPRSEGEVPRPGRFLADLRVPVGAHGWVSHQATVEFGDIERSPRACRMTITISSSRRFPTFRGTIEARDVLGDTVLALSGACQVPLGIAGHMGDAAGGSMAWASMRRFFESATKALNADLAATASPWRPAVVPDSLREP